jgi:hypothetical protein
MEKDLNQNMESVRNLSAIQVQNIYVLTSAKSKEFNISRGDDPAIKEEKKRRKSELWENYHVQKDLIESRRNDELACLFAKNFFEKLAADDDAIGWKWSLAKDKSCDSCKMYEGKYPKGQGPKFPAHAGCTCNLSVIYQGESLK